ncbi:MAG: FeoB small GTPase domain-containing protein [Euryarchaeota archaeon]|nr:FeoB small GTPase domain-containing protein [Euryarchaeota archaeon]
MITVALIGNPNVGKTAAFNQLTGMKEHVGNWPGVTVEKKTGKCKYDGEEIELVDLPGTYSLTARSMDELVARNFIVEEKPDAVIDIVNNTNMERNLYLTFLLIELEAKIVLTINQWTGVGGIEIDEQKLSGILGMPVVPIVATTGEGMEELKKVAVEVAKEKGKRANPIDYGEDINALIKKVEAGIKKDTRLSSKYPTRWLAIKVLEKDEEVLKEIDESPHKGEIIDAAG